MASPARPARVLILEDDAATADVLKEMLTEAGYRPVVCDHLPDLADVQQLRPDVILLDLIFGGRPEGRDYLLQLRRTPPTARLPVIICSGAPALFRDAFGAPLGLANDVVLKPFDVDVLLTSVERALAPRVGPRGMAPAPWIISAGSDSGSEGVHQRGRSPGY
jgi:CheY-like chemotaxis protein